MFDDVFRTYVSGGYQNWLGLDGFVIAKYLTDDVLIYNSHCVSSERDLYRQCYCSTSELIAIAMRDGVYGNKDRTFEFCQCISNIIWRKISCMQYENP